MVKVHSNKDSEFEYKYFNCYNCCKLSIMVIIINMSFIGLKIIRIMNHSCLIIDLCMINMDLMLVIEIHIMNL